MCATACVAIAGHCLPLTGLLVFGLLPLVLPPLGDAVCVAAAWLVLSFFGNLAVVCLPLLGLPLRGLLLCCLLLLGVDWLTVGFAARAFTGLDFAPWLAAVVACSACVTRADHFAM